MNGYLNLNCMNYVRNCEILKMYVQNYEISFKSHYVKFESPSALK